MSLETGTYISDLSESNPPGADPKSQGDDHLRLVKSVAKATFPNASKAFRFPTTAAEASGTVNVTFPTDQNKLFPVSAAGANRVVNLPDPTTGATVNEDGFSIAVVKTDSSSNTVTVTASGAQTVNGASTLVLTKQWDIALLTWAKTDAEWYAIYTPAEASETIKGLVERATDAEAAAGSDATRYISAAQLHEARADVASGASTDLGAVASNFVRITGTTTITSFGTAAAGVWRDVTFAAALTLTHHATNLIIPGGANITTAADDRLRARSLGAGAWIVLNYTKASGVALVASEFFPSSGVNIPARAYDEETTHVTTTNAIPLDDTIPQVGEGAEILSLSIAAKRADSKIRVSFSAFASIGNNETGVFALFYDGGADAIQVTTVHLSSGNQILPSAFVVEITPGDTSSHAFSVRMGSGSGATMAINGTSAARRFGGAARAVLIAEEIFV